MARELMGLLITQTRGQTNVFVTGYKDFENALAQYVVWENDPDLRIELYKRRVDRNKYKSNHPRYQLIRHKEFET